jgi:hypothetical protein
VFNDIILDVSELGLFHLGLSCRSIHVVANNRISFFLKAGYYSIAELLCKMLQ